jgi:hypothetical protein
MSTTAPATPKSHASSPLPRLVLGALLLLFWLVAMILQIQTSEAFILKGSMVSLHPNWSIIMQPIALVAGTLSPALAKATMWGWGIELIFLVCVIGYEIAHEGIFHANKKLAPLFRTVSLILIGFDAYTDFNYGQLASGFWGQAAFAAIMAFIVFFFGTIGLRFIEYGIAEWNK